MRDTDRRDDVAARPLPGQRAPSPTAETEPLPVDEAGLEHGDDRGGPTEPPRPDAAPVDAAPVNAIPPHPPQDGGLFAGDVAQRLRARWRELQADFVDDPQRAVREADEVVDEVMRTIAEHRQRLVGEWQGHTDTEHLRLALREYRSFFDRLLPS